jgi:hypothetical protein
MSLDRWFWKIRLQEEEARSRSQNYSPGGELKKGWYEIDFEGHYYKRKFEHIG